MTIKVGSQNVPSKRAIKAAGVIRLMLSDVKRLSSICLTLYGEGSRCYLERTELLQKCENITLQHTRHESLKLYTNTCKSNVAKYTTS